MTDRFRLHQFSNRKSCYFCGAPPPSTREHAPPSMMFGSLSCDSITVPACVTHNTQKSIGDRAIATSILMGAYQVWKHRPSSPSLTPNVIHCIEMVEPDFHQARNEVSLRNFLIDPPPELNVPLPYTQPNVRIREWIIHLTAALVWSAVGKHDPSNEWDKAWAWSPGFVPISVAIDLEVAAQFFIQNREFEAQLNSFDWYDGWSARPREYPRDIYTFSVCFLDNLEEWDGVEVVFRHRFYNNASVWYTFLKGSVETNAGILKAVA